MSRSIRVDHQERKWTVYFQEAGREHKLVAVARYDDDYKNGHNSFSLTATVYRGRCWVAGGCLRDEIAQHLPELAKYIKWHLCSSDEPLHYIENTAYWAGQRGFTTGNPGGPPNLTHARSTAIWPDATDEELLAPGLEDRLKARLPALLEDFQLAMESLGFTY